ncbi:hypothetical protein M513_07344 [Trichuris suis]|uniref:Uncharacterized protein n=1 Tax=Trichuris suis TaxID=68888 RepID=A0A085M3M1_9BILA|nr:hypothetical protein M513_07344 [Trichuris suis]
MITCLHSGTYREETRFHIQSMLVASLNGLAELAANSYYVLGMVRKVWLKMFRCPLEPGVFPMLSQSSQDEMHWRGAK